MQPDEYSQRFGLRKSVGEAVDRAQYFMEWTPDGLKGECHQGDYIVIQVEILEEWIAERLHAVWWWISFRRWLLVMIWLKNIKNCGVVSVFFA